jgi:hypothetical protein
MPVELDPVPPLFHLTELDLPYTPSAVTVDRTPCPMLPSVIAEAACDPDPSNMYMRMCYLLQALGKEDLAKEMQAKALERRCLYRISSPSSPAVKLLALMGPGGMLENTPLDYVVENSVIRLDLLYVHPDLKFPAHIPDHDIAIVALAESDKNHQLLMRLDAILAHWPRPVLNNPRRVLGCARNAVFQQLQDVPNLLVPEVHRCNRSRAMHDVYVYPMTIRPIDTHCGKGLMKINSKVELDAYFSNTVGDEFFVSEYVDYRSHDGLFRKLRIALIDGKPYLCHLAISDHWVVHYLSSGMQKSDEKRAEEAEMMESFESDFAVRHHRALKTISDKLGLDYVILDCGETRDGRLLLFEADTRGWVHATDSVDIFPYKQKGMYKVFSAFKTMLLSRSQVGRP